METLEGIIKQSMGHDKTNIGGLTILRHDGSLDYWQIDLINDSLVF